MAAYVIATWQEAAAVLLSGAAVQMAALMAHGVGGWYKQEKGASRPDQLAGAEVAVSQARHRRQPPRVLPQRHRSQPPAAITTTSHRRPSRGGWHAVGRSRGLPAVGGGPDRPVEGSGGGQPAERSWGLQPAICPCRISLHKQAHDGVSAITPKPAAHQASPLPQTGCGSPLQLASVITSPYNPVPPHTTPQDPAGSPRPQPSQIR